MNYKKLIAVTIALTVCAFTGSNVLAHGGSSGHGGFLGGGGFHGGGFHGGGSRGHGFNGSAFRGGSAFARLAPSFNRAGPRVAHGMTRSGTFRNGGSDHGRFHHRNFNDPFFFFGDFGGPFFYYPYPYYGYYPYGDYSYDYGYDSYNQPGYRGGTGYTDSLVGQVQRSLARAGYYHGSIDGVNGNGTRRAIREYERAHGLPRAGKIGQQLLTTMGLS